MVLSGHFGSWNSNCKNREILEIVISIVGSKKEDMGRIGWKMPNHLHIKFQAHGLLAFTSLSISSWIKNCDLTFVESLGFPPLAPMQLGFCRGWASQRKNSGICWSQTSCRAPSVPSKEGLRLVRESWGRGGEKFHEITLTHPQGKGAMVISSGYQSG